MIRRVGEDVADVVPHDELVRRKEEAEWRAIERRWGTDLREEHALLALRPGDTVQVADYTGEMRWFVTDVNGIMRTITARTLIFECLVERTFPFQMVSPCWGLTRADRNENALYWNRLKPKSGAAPSALPLAA